MHCVDSREGDESARAEAGRVGAESASLPVTGVHQCYGVDPHPRIQRARNHTRADTNIDNVNNSIFERLPRYTTPTIKSLTHPNIDLCQRLSTGSHRQTSDHLLTPARDIPPIIGRYRPTNDGKTRSSANADHLLVSSFNIQTLSTYARTTRQDTP